MMAAILAVETPGCEHAPRTKVIRKYDIQQCLMDVFHDVHPRLQDKRYGNDIVCLGSSKVSDEDGAFELDFGLSVKSIVEDFSIKGLVFVLSVQL